MTGLVTTKQSGYPPAMDDADATWLDVSANALGRAAAQEEYAEGYRYGAKAAKRALKADKVPAELPAFGLPDGPVHMSRWQRGWVFGWIDRAWGFGNAKPGVKADYHYAGGYESGRKEGLAAKAAAQAADVSGYVTWSQVPTISSFNDPRQLEREVGHLFGFLEAATRYTEFCMAEPGSAGKPRLR